MAFWGIEVKPGRPYTHSYDRRKGRLHVSQATLGSGTATVKSLVQCNVGNKCPVFLCSLFPIKNESCQLNLEFEEDEDVVFSVIGPLSVHLTGYFLEGGRQNNQIDDSESYGEDIAETESERSLVPSEEDEYEDSFINDGDVEPQSSSDGEDEKMLKNRKRKLGTKGHRRLKKSYQLSDSEKEESYEQTDDTGKKKSSKQEDINRKMNIAVQEDINGKNGLLMSESEDDDWFTVSSLLKSNAAGVKKSEAEEKASTRKSEKSKRELENDQLRKEADNIICGSKRRCPDDVVKRKKKRKEHLSDATVDEIINVAKDEKAQQDNGSVKENVSKPLAEVDPAGATRTKKKRRKEKEESRSVESNGCHHAIVVNEDKVQGNEQNKKQAKDDVSEPLHEVDPESGKRLKKKKNEERAKGRSVESNGFHDAIVVNEGKAEGEQNKKQEKDEILNTAEEEIPREKQPEVKKMKKKKKKKNESQK